MDALRGIGPQQQPEGVEPKKLVPNDPNAPNFGEVLGGFLKDVNHMQSVAGESIQKMVAGEIKDPHQVMLAMGEAKVTFNMMLEIRNKTMEAYQELIKMRG